MKKLLFILFNILYFHATGQVISTVAGDGTGSYSGDSGLAILAGIGYAGTITFDKFGNYYIAELNNTVRKISASGIITTIAGNDTAGFSGDGGLAINAEFNFTGGGGMACDSTGNLFIADQSNNRIRKIDAFTGIVTTIAGTGIAGFSGDSGLATAAELNSPQRLTMDEIGNLYFTDAFNNRIRKIDTAGIITTIAGNGTAASTGDSGLAIMAEVYAYSGIYYENNKIYICDGANVRVIYLATGYIYNFAGNGIYGFGSDGGKADTATLSLIEDVTADLYGNVYISEVDNNRIRKVDTAGIINTVAGNGTAGYSGDGDIADSAELYSPRGIATDACGNLYIVDNGNNRIRKVTFNTNMPAIAISSLSGDTVCAGTPVTYSATVTGSTTFAYKWLVNSTTVSTAGSTYSYIPAGGDSIQCIFMGTGQCSGALDTASSNTIIMTVDTFTTPTIAISGTSSAMVSSTVSLTATVSNAGSSYTIKWYDNGTLFATTTSLTASYIKTGDTDSITAVIIPTGGCYDSVTSAAHVVTVNDDAVPGIATQPITIYPNPAHNQITITGNNITNITITNITITNTIGQTLLTQNNKGTINIIALPTGIYFVKVTDNEGRKTVNKIVKQ